MSEFELRLLAMINEDVSLDPTVQVAAETDLLLTGLVDSLGVMTIVEWIEQDAGVEIDPADIVLEHFQTVSRMATFVATLCTT